MSELRKSENNAHTAHYYIHSPKLHENILNEISIKLFKEISNGLNTGIMTTLDFPSSHSDGLLVLHIDFSLPASADLVKRMCLKVNNEQRE